MNRWLRHLGLAFAALLVSCGGGGGGGASSGTATTNCSAGVGSTCQSIVVDGVTRTYVLHVPANFSRTSALVLFLHGYGSDGSIYEAVTRLSDTADRENFIIAYPDALVEFVPQDLQKATRYGNSIDAAIGNRRNWTHYGNAFHNNDIPFLRALIAKLQQTHAINPKKVYLAGQSSGAMMAHRAGIEMGDVIAAIGVHGQWTYWNIDRMDPRPNPLPNARSPVSVVMLQGELDQYCGTPGRTASQDEVFNYWAGPQANSCNAVAPSGSLCNGGQVGAIHTKTAGACASGTQVQLYKLLGGDHPWTPDSMDDPARVPFSADLNPSTGVTINDVIWKFFVAHPKP